MTGHTKEITQRQFIRNRTEVTGNQVYNYTSILNAAAIIVLDIRPLSFIQANFILFNVAVFSPSDSPESYHLSDE